jgi:hypothetical protein
MANEQGWQHLGDGVYASFDGYQIALRANSPANPTDTIYLDPQVRDALANYMRMIDQASDTDKEA